MATSSITLQQEICRPHPNFPPSLWGDLFSKFDEEKQMQQKEVYAKEIEELKESAKRMLIFGKDGILLDKLMMIDTIERLGLSHHFEKEIEEQLEQIYLMELFTNNDDDDDDEGDLFLVSLHFRLLRQHGYNISSGVFTKFKESDGQFSEILKSDISGLLALYEASYWKTHGEEILEEAFQFITPLLELFVAQNSSILAKRVAYALKHPIHRGIPRMQMWNFIFIYEKSDMKNDTLLRFAKLDFNIQQILHNKELHELSRWDYSELDRLPDYMKLIYSMLLDLFEDFIEQFKSREDTKSLIVNHIKEAMKQLVTGYMIEMKWFKKENYPKFAEYVANGVITSTYYVLVPVLCLGIFLSDNNMNATIANEVYSWLFEDSKSIQAVATIGRLDNDLVSFEREKEMGQTATGIECYMKEYDVSKEETFLKFREISENAWKDINEGCLKPTKVPSSIIGRVPNLGRVTDFVYKNEDSYTTPAKRLQPVIVALLVEPILIDQ